MPLAPLARRGRNRSRRRRARSSGGRVNGVPAFTRGSTRERHGLQQRSDHVVGTLLLGLALLKSRRVPAVYAWALALSQPLHLVSFVVLGVQPLDVFAWCLTAVGMGAAAWALLSGARRTRERLHDTAFAAAGT